MTFRHQIFYITDLINRKEVSIEHCSRNDMLADHHTKPLIGEKVKTMRDKIMNMHIVWTAGVCWKILRIFICLIYTNEK